MVENWMSDLQKELAKKIADEGEYMPGPAECDDLCALENAGMVELAGLYHPVAATWRITDQGKKWHALGKERSALVNAAKQEGRRTTDTERVTICVLQAL